ncbi:amino acid permease [Nadsonia fulvescens var. elongata DSM 6958]|uniref:Amino acid permease n=1 Tax=Nadsonia fulvescens var. elongata DSM 6958 TaxID=857566 RepID=A0A1E3PLE2_9ASCO|nr:amino acid permease [Nadsonia fulvescens var. elongata DSM 6958]
MNKDIQPAFSNEGSSYLNDTEKGGFTFQQTPSEYDGAHKDLLEGEEGHTLNRDLKARHITMIAIGGAVGTGLVIGTGSALSSAGPASILIAYTLVGLAVYMVMCALGEMATYLPLPDGFPGYASRFVDDALGFAVGYSYWFKYIIVTPNQLTAAALVIQYWISRDKVNPGVWITIFLVVIVAINYFGVKFFGEFEFWLSSIKIVTVCGLIILSLVIALGGGPDHDRRGFRYWRNPGAFKEFTKGDIHMHGAKGKFVAWASVLVTAVFAYLGTELVGVTVGEAQNPRRNIPRAIKLTFYRIIIFYCVSILFIGMCVPYNDPALLQASKAKTSASASPFVVAIKNAGIKGLPAVINAAILLFVFSASNSDLYIATRTLYGLSVNGKAPKIFSKTNKSGVPYYALLLSSAFCGLAYMNVASNSAKVFGYFVNLVSIFGLLTWISILITHIGFMRACKAQGIDRHTDLVYCAPLAPYGTYASLGFCVLVAFIKNFTAFIGEFDVSNFITGYLGIPVYLILFIGYKVVKKTKFVKPAEADLYTLKDIIDREEELFLIEQERQLLENPPRGITKIYNNSIGLLF